MTIHQFAKLAKTKKEELIQKQAVFLESFTENENLVNLYYLDGFFIEITLSPLQNDPIDIIPYKRGYNIKNYRKQLMTHYKHVFETLKVAA
jgi:hypothetical protein